MNRPTLLAPLALLLAASPAFGGVRGADVQARLTADVKQGRPLIVHVVVALCDNRHQGIVPVPEHLGDGQDPGTNLYWGALYGVRTHLARNGWTTLPSPAPDANHILERRVFFRNLDRGEASASVYLIADAWDGQHIKAAVRRFLEMAAGGAREEVPVAGGESVQSIDAGGAAHIVAYVGHNGLMDFSVPGSPAGTEGGAPRSAIVLACASKDYFLDHLQAASAHPLLLATGLMAPEAYTLDAVVRAWLSGAASAEALDAAAAAYDRYQKCGIGPARRLFWGAP